MNLKEISIKRNQYSFLIHFFLDFFYYLFIMKRIILSFDKTELKNELLCLF